MKRLTRCAVVLPLLALTFASDLLAGDSSNDRVVIAYNDNDTPVGRIMAISAEQPFNTVSEILTVGQFSILRQASGRIYAVSQYDGTITVIDAASFDLINTFELGANSQVRDIAVIDPQTAYVTRMAHTHLLRLDLGTGETTEVVDLSLFADEDGIPDMNMMSVYDDLLLIQIRRTNLDHPMTFVPPAMLAVVDLSTETLLDADDNTPGIQALELAGTAPKFKMQILPQSTQLFISATGTSWDAGGIELIDLNSLQSLGLGLFESDGQTGVDLGAFVMTTANSGYLSFTTDFALSSHLVAFNIPGGVIPGPGLYAALGYFAPALLHDDATDYLYFPDGSFPSTGVQVFDVVTGEQLTDDVISTNGPPTDLLLVRGNECLGDVDSDGNVGVADLLALLAAWGPNQAHPADFDENGIVDVLDLLLLLAAWGRCA